MQTSNFRPLPSYSCQWRISNLASDIKKHYFRNIYKNKHNAELQRKPPSANQSGLREIEDVSISGWSYPVEERNKTSGIYMAKGFKLYEVKLKDLSDNK